MESQLTNGHGSLLNKTKSQISLKNDPFLSSSWLNKFYMLLKFGETIVESKEVSLELVCWWVEEIKRINALDIDPDTIEMNEDNIEVIKAKLEYWKKLHQKLEIIFGKVKNLIIKFQTGIDYEKLNIERSTYANGYYSSSQIKSLGKNLGLKLTGTKAQNVVALKKYLNELGHIEQNESSDK